MSSIINFDYKGSQISFEKGKNVMVNLTSMAKPFPEKNLTQIINSQEINDYCTSLSKLQNYSLADLLIVRRGGNNNGTWAHRLVAIRVAQKLNSDFAVWVDMRIEELLTTGVATVSNDDEAIAYAMQVLNRRLEESKAEKERLEQQNQLQSEQLRLTAPKVKYVDNVLQSVNTHTATQLAKELGFTSGEALNKKLKEMGIQYKVGSTWVLTAKYQNMGYTESSTYTETTDEETRSYVSTVWTQKGREFIHILFRTNKETTLFSNVPELKHTFQEEDDLRKRVESLGKPILNDMKQIPLLLDKYKMMCNSSDLI